MKSAKLVLFLLFTVLAINSCVDTSTDLEHDNPYDSENPGNSGDPYNLTAEIADGGIRLTWNVLEDPEPEGYNLYRKVNGEEYYLYAELENAASHTDTEIANGFRYEYYVVARTTAGEGDASNVISVSVDIDPLLFIEGENETHTPSRNVGLTLLAFGASEMILSNNPDFSDAEWETYATSKEWTLTTGSGVKTVYMQVIYSDGDTSDVISDNIQPFLPDNLSVEILSPTMDDTVSSNIVDLLFTAEYADSVQVSNTDDFADDTWLVYSDTLRDWHLNDGLGRTILYQRPKVGKERGIQSISKNKSKGASVYNRVPTHNSLGLDAIEQTVFARFKNSFEVPSNAVNDDITVEIRGTIEINDGADSTSSRYIFLSLNLAEGAEAEQMRLAWTEETLSGSVWVPFQTQVDDHALATGAGPKHVYVQFRNSSGAESGVYFDSIEPTSLSASIVIDGNATATPTRNVPLTIEATGAFQMQIANEEVPTGDVWLEYSTTIDPWELVTGAGTKTVYLRIRNDFLIEEVVTDQIEPLLPTDLSIEVLSPTSDNIVSSNIVDLLLSAELTDSVQVSNSDNFADAAWVSYSDTLQNWHLVDGWNGQRVNSIKRYNASSFTETSSRSLSSDKKWGSLELDAIDYTVHARFKNGFEAPSITVSDDITMEIRGTVEINAGADSTSTRNVSLFLNLVEGAEAEQMRLAWTEETLSGSDWIPYQAQVDDYALATGAGTKYVYVQFRNSSGAESGVYSDSIEPKLLSASIVIDGDAASTSIRNVPLTIEATGAIEMQIANETAPTGDEWQGYSTSVNPWELVTGAGTKTVYVRVRNDFLIDELVSDEIEPSSLNPSIVINSNDEYTNSRTVSLTMPAVGAFEMKLSEDENGAGSNWETYTEISSFDLSDSDGLKTVYAWFRHDFYNTDSVSDVIGLDRQTEVQSFGWSTTGGDTLFQGDQVTFTLEISDDSFGAETGGEATVTVAGWDPITLSDQNNGSYRRTITISSDHPRVTDASVTATFSDRVGNSAPAEVAQEAITAWWNLAGDEHTFALGSSGETIDMVWVPAGTFWMGAQDDETDAIHSERPRHEVTISEGFWMGKYEVTQAQWEAVMGDWDFSFDGHSNRPAEMVSHNDIMNDFLHELDAEWSLPTEAEWEYACRGGVDDEWFWWGSSYDNLGNYAWYNGNSDSQTHDVGTRDPNPWGLYDMHGNVSEWCADWYSSNYYDTSPDTDPENTTPSSDRVFRGGSWLNAAERCRAASRSDYNPSSRVTVIGFRLVRNVD
jgi:formylglycine-generating enzyme required for sulfatase activity